MDDPGSTLRVPLSGFGRTVQFDAALSWSVAELRQNVSTALDVEVSECRCLKVVSRGPVSASWMFEAGDEQDDNRLLSALNLSQHTTIVVAHASAFSQPVVLPSQFRMPRIDSNPTSRTNSRQPSPSLAAASDSLPTEIAFVLPSSQLTSRSHNGTPVNSLPASNAAASTQSASNSRPASRSASPRVDLGQATSAAEEERMIEEAIRASLMEQSNMEVSEPKPRSRPSSTRSLPTVSTSVAMNDHFGLAQVSSAALPPVYSLDNQNAARRARQAAAADQLAFERSQSRNAVSSSTTSTSKKAALPSTSAQPAVSSRPANQPNIDDDERFAAMLLDEELQFVDADSELQIIDDYPAPSRASRNNSRNQSRTNSRNSNRVAAQAAAPASNQGAQFELRDFSYEALLALDDTVEKIGFTPAQIARLPSFQFVENGATEDRECSICLTQFESNEEVTLLPCFCRFHSECIAPWLKCNKTCPRDRTRLQIE